jgi:hypothetical protein
MAVLRAFVFREHRVLVLLSVAPANTTALTDLTAKQDLQSIIL